MSNSAHNISHEEIVELQEKFWEIKHTINIFLAAMMALAEMSQRRPEFSEKLASTVLTKSPRIVSALGKFTQALNEKAGAPEEFAQLQKKFSEMRRLREHRAGQFFGIIRAALRHFRKRQQKIEKEITIINRLGLDAVPAAMFVRIASRFRSEIWVEKEGERINGKSIMGLMMLAAGQGSKLHIRCEGPDADRAMQELEQLIKNRFNED